MHMDSWKKQDDIGEFLAFCHEMIEASYYPAYSREVTGLFVDYHNSAAIAADAASGRIWCARENGRMVGTVTVAGGELSRMFVLPEFRGGGVGTRLVAMALAYARETGIRKLTAWAVPFSMGFYEKLGFRMLNADTINFDHTRQPAVPYVEMALWPGGPTSIEIGRALGCDADEILTGQRAAFEEQCRLYDDWQIPPMKERPEDVARFLADGGTVLKACAGGRIIGAVRGKVENGICQVGRLFVSPDWQGWSVGRSLVARLEMEFGDCRSFEIFTGEKSEKNLSLYLGQGYSLTGRRAPARPPGTSGNYDLVWLDKPNPWPEISECIRRYATA